MFFSSYGSRLTLIKSVHGTLGTYFFSLFNAPKSVINHLEKIRRNFFWGGSLDSNKMAWVSWKKVCSPKSCGGLEIGSLHALNLAMLVKWWWRFHSETNSLWKNTITSIYGIHGGLGLEAQPRSMSSPWNSIIGLRKSLLCLNINLDSIFVRKVGNGASFKFWEETWHGDTSFKDIYPRLYALESSKSCNINERCSNSNGPLTRSWAWRRPLRSGLEMEQLAGLTNILLTFDITNCQDSWVCSIENNKPYRVSAMRKVIEGCILESGVDNIRWNKSVPFKINIHSWRLSNNRLPTRFNLDARGIDLHSVRCPICDEDVETSHVH